MTLAPSQLKVVREGESIAFKQDVAGHGQHERAQAESDGEEKRGERARATEDAHGGILYLARQSDGPLSAIKWHKTGWPFSGRIPEHQEQRDMAVVQDQRNMEVSFCFSSPGCAAVPALDKEGT